MLAVALLVVELISGMQLYLSQTVLPLVAKDLDGRHLYGVVAAAGQATMFLTMPLGGWLLSRFRLSRLMLVLTVATVAGALLSATATEMGQFIAGAAVRGLAGGALATVSIGAMAYGLPQDKRQLVFAGLSAMWVISSLVGPLYAAWAAALWGWRWAMVLYLPLLLAARAVIARQVPTQPPSGDKAPIGASVAMALGAVAVALPAGRYSAVAVALGIALMLGATYRVVPRGVFTARAGVPAALLALLWLSACYFGATEVLGVVAHDVFGFGAAGIGVVIAAPALAWALLGIWSGARPALAPDSFRARARTGWLLLTCGLGVYVAAAFGVGAETPGTLGTLVIAGVVSGAGMALLYPDLLGICFCEQPGFSVPNLAMSVVVLEAVGSALATTIAFTWFGAGGGLVDDPVERGRFWYVAMAALVLPLVVVIHRIASGLPGPAEPRAAR